jgi:phosphoserine phosphatase
VLRLAIFDFDGTLSARDTLPLVGREWLRQGRSRARYAAVYLRIIPWVAAQRAGVLSRERMKEAAVTRFHSMFAGMTAGDIDDFFRRAWGELRLRLVAPVAAEVARARDAGFHLVLLSGAYQQLLERAGEELGFDTVLGVRLHGADEGAAGPATPPCIDGARKLVLLRQRFPEGVDWAASTAYADSWDDLPLLQAVGLPVAVNPEPRLRAHAQREGWRVLDAC